jgi:hypothetical protein
MCAGDDLDAFIASQTAETITQMDEVV